MSDFIYENVFCSITKDLLKTRRKTYKISHIEKTAIKYNLLFLFPLSVLLLFGCYRYSMFLYGYEIFFINILSIIFMFISFSVCSLQIHSRSIEEGVMFGYVPTISKIRKSLDHAVYLNEKGINE